MSTRVVQISDCHLFADVEQELRGVQPQVRVTQALEHVFAHEERCDYLVISGDLAHDEIKPTYLRLREMLGDWVPRCRIIPGNHDHRQFMHEVFPEILDGNHESVCFDLQVPGWLVMGLDSHVPGEVPGELSATQWQWLEKQLATYPDQPTLLFMHHPPFSINTPWLDEIGLRDADRFLQLLNSSPQVRVVCCGHVHQEFRGQHEQVEFLTTPSITVQFRPRTETAEIDSLPAGYRVFDLHEDGSHETEVIRLAPSG